MMLLTDARLGAPSAEEVMARARTENFPVASRLLPRRVRRHLLAVYGFARLVDELGDSLSGDRLGALDDLQDELERAFEGRAEHPLMRRLGETLRECSLPREPFERLIEANRQDQLVAGYETWQQLRGYCALSADPVGEIVLYVFGAATPQRIALSDCICTALQLAEHCQDVAEDFAAGRVYLPQEDLQRFGCDRQRLLSEPHGPLRAVLAFEVGRARELLREGEALVDHLHGRERLAVAGFVAGGRSALEAIACTGYDVLSHTPRAGRVARLRALVAVLAQSRRRRRLTPLRSGGG